jgi:hypothetical protein
LAVAGAAAVSWPGGCCLLELDEQHVRGRGAGVLARVGLGWQPVGAARFHDDIARALACVQPALEPRQRVHDAVGVLVREGLVAGQVAVLKHAHPVVLEDDLVLIRVGAHLVIGEDSLRAGCDRDHAAATFFALVNSHCYQLLATHLGWSPADWQRWLTNVLDRELFGS